MILIKERNWHQIIGKLVRLIKHDTTLVNLDEQHAHITKPMTFHSMFPEHAVVFHKHLIKEQLVNFLNAVNTLLGLSANLYIEKQQILDWVNQFKEFPHNTVRAMVMGMFADGTPAEYYVIFQNNNGRMNLYITAPITNFADNHVHIFSMLLQFICAATGIKIGDLYYTSPHIYIDKVKYLQYLQEGNILAPNDDPYMQTAKCHNTPLIFPSPTRFIEEGHIAVNDAVLPGMNIFWRKAYFPFAQAFQLVSKGEKVPEDLLTNSIAKDWRMAITAHLFMDWSGIEPETSSE